MLEKVNLSKITQSYNRIKNTSNQTLSRVHYINFLKAEKKFCNSLDRYETNLEKYSYPDMVDVLGVIKHGAIMISEKIKSVYYFQK